MNILIHVIFEDQDIPTIKWPAYHVPRIGDKIEFEHGVVKYYNGVETEQNTFQVTDVIYQVEDGTSRVSTVEIIVA